MLEGVRREALSSAELTGVVDLLLQCSGRSHQEYLLHNPRECLEQAGRATEIASRDPRLSPTGNEVFKRTGILIAMLGCMEVWLSHRGRAALTPGDYPLIASRFERLARDAASVASLSRDLILELQPS